MIKVQNHQEHTLMIVMFTNNIGMKALININGEDTE